MSYNGTVCCGHCGKQGHNRRGCVSLKEYVKENPDSWEANRAMIQATSAKKRHCSYCQAVGHTRRTCVEKKTHVADFIATNRVFVERVVPWLKKEGIEPGALIKVKENNWDSKSGDYIKGEYIYLITGIRYGEINYETLNSIGYRYSTPEVVLAKRIDKKNHLRALRLPHHEELHNLNTQYRDHEEQYTVVSKIKSCSVYPPGMPADFLGGSMGLRDTFDNPETQSGKRTAQVSNRNSQEYQELQEKMQES